MFQLFLLEALAADSNSISSIAAASLAPMAAYPRGQRILVKSATHVLNHAIELKVIPFLNLGYVIKNFTAMIGFCGFLMRKTILRRQLPDVVILYNLNLCYSIPAFLLGLLADVPFFPIVADLPMPGSLSPRTLLRRIDAFLQKYLAKKGDGLIVLSRAIAADFAPGNKFLHMEGGIAKSLFDLERRDTFSRRGSEEAASILYAGTLGENGGISLLLEAFGKVKEKNCELRICGRGPLAAEIESAAQQDGRIKFFGFVERERLLELLTTSTILVNPRPKHLENRYSFPSKLLEYMASGRPVITTATTDVAEEYGDKAFILWEDTPDALAEIIGNVCELPSQYLNEFGAKARNYVLQNKNWDVQARRVYDFMDEVIGMKEKSRR